MLTSVVFIVTFLTGTFNPINICSAVGYGWNADIKF